MSFFVKPIFSLGVVAFALALSACGSSSDDNSGSKDSDKKQGQSIDGQKQNPKDTDSKNENSKGATQPLDCATAWANYQTQNPEGAFEKYQTTLVTTTAGRSSESKSKYSSKVLKSSSEAVTTESKIQIGEQPENTNSSTMTKAGFLSSCEKVDPDAGKEKLPNYETGKEEVTVPAGKFQTKWVKYSTGAEAFKSLNTIYLSTLPSGAELMIKTTNESTFSEGTSKSVSTTVLLETNRK